MLHERQGDRVLQGPTGPAETDIVMTLQQKY